MASITRTQYRNAILSGIRAVSPVGLAFETVEEGPTLDDLTALLKIADTDKEFGTNFCTEPVACPMGRLGYYDAKQGRTAYDWATKFATAFDDAWVPLVPIYWHRDGDTIQVTD